MAAAVTRTPTKQVKRRLSSGGEDWQSPSKRSCRSRSPRKSPTKSKERLATKSFYGGAQSRYISPLERKELRDKLPTKSESDPGLKSIENIVSPKSVSRKLPKSKTQNRPVSRNKARSNSLPPPQSSGFASKYRKGTSSLSSSLRNGSQSSVTSSPADKVSDVSDISESPDKQPQKKFFRTRLSPGDKSKAGPQVVLRKGLNVAYQKSKNPVNNATANEQVTKPVNRTQRQKVNGGLLASLSAIKRLKTDHEELSESVSGESDISRTLGSSLSESSGPVSRSRLEDDTESLLNNICDEMEAENFDTTVDSACHSRTSAGTTDSTTDSRNTSYNDSARADSVMLLSECSSSDKSNSAQPCTPNKANSKKVYSIFQRSSPRLKNKQSSLTSSPSCNSVASSPDSTSSRRKQANRAQGLPRQRDRDGKAQMILDFGQKLKGPIQCEQCGMHYTEGEPSDEATHMKFHKTVINALKFQGWKKERVCQHNSDFSRIVVITSEDKFATKKVDAIRQIVDNELGFVVEQRKLTEDMKTYLYISEDQRVIGCCIAEGISKGYRMLSGSQSDDSEETIASKTWCCSTKPTAAKCGVSRIWVLACERRKQIASKLLDCVRGNFLMGYPLKKTDLAFSDPTPAGRSFAANYVGSSHFLVYKHNGD